MMVTCGAGLRPILERAMSSRVLSWLFRSKHSSGKLLACGTKGTGRFRRIGELEMSLRTPGGGGEHGSARVVAGNNGGAHSLEHSGSLDGQMGRSMSSQGGVS